jgi:hypothetical protein
MREDRRQNMNALLNGRENIMIKKVLLLAVALALAVAGAARLSAQTGPNGTDPRPFYVIGHNPNTLEMAELALFSGANALEPDLIVLPDALIAKATQIRTVIGC